MRTVLKYPFRMSLNFFIADIGSILPAIISGAEVVQRDSVWTLQHGDGTRFALEAFYQALSLASVYPVQKLPSDHFDRCRTRQEKVFGPVDVCHAS